MTQTQLIIDTGFFLALFSKTDSYHKKALQLRKTIEHKKWVTTWPVLTEVCHLLSIRGAGHTLRQLFQLHENGGFDIFPISSVHVPQMIQLLEKYEALPMDLADASLLILAEEL